MGNKVPFRPIPWDLGLLLDCLFHSVLGHSAASPSLDLLVPLNEIHILVYSKRATAVNSP